jgi:hypothetical protein
LNKYSSQHEPPYILESINIISEYSKENDSKKLYEIMSNKGIFGQKTENSKKKLYSIVRSIYLKEPTAEFISLLSNENVSFENKKMMLYYHRLYSRPFINDFMSDFVFKAYIKGQKLISKPDVISYLENKVQDHPEIRSWSQSNVSAFSSNILGLLRAFGFLDRDNKILRPNYSDEFILYVLHDLYNNKKVKKSKIVDAPVFKSLLINNSQIIRFLEKMGKNQKIVVEINENKISKLKLNSEILKIHNM